VTEKFWDRDAPYGPNGYTFGRGEWVESPAVRSIQFRMRDGDQCLARGVMETEDGHVYTWTVLREGREHRPDVPRRLASRVRQSFTVAAREMLKFEQACIEPDMLGYYAQQVDALTDNALRDNVREWSAVHYGENRTACGAALRNDDRCTKDLNAVRCMDCLEVVNASV
jgi:hypothetical protein